MAAIHGANVVAYNIAREIVNDMIFEMKDDIYDEIDEDSDTDGICIIVRQEDNSTQTWQKCDDSNDSSDDTDRYVDTMTSRSEDTAIDEEGKDVFVDAEEETSRENLRSNTSNTETNTETNEEIEVEEAVRDTLNKIMTELIESEEMATSDQHSSVGADYLAENASIQPNQNSELPGTVRSATEIEACSGNSALTALEDMDGEIEFYDSYAVFSPYNGGSSVVCSTEANYVQDTAIGTASEMFSEGSIQMSGANNVVFSHQGFANVNTTHYQSCNGGFEYPITDNYDDAHQFSLAMDDLGNTPEVQCQSPNGLMKKCDIAEEENTLHGRPRPCFSDLAEPNDTQDFYESSYGDADISHTPCETPSETWYDPLTSADDIDASQHVDTFSEDIVVQINNQNQAETATSSTPDSPDTQKPIDSIPTSTNENIPLFPKYSLNPECEPFVPTQNYNSQYTAYSNGDNTCPTTESHSEALTFGGASHLPAYNPEIGYPNHFQGQTCMFPMHPCTDNGYFAEALTQYGPGHSAYPVYPTNMTAPNSNFYNTVSSFQQADQQLGHQNQHLQYPITSSNTGSQSTNFRYPAIYLSEAGLITVLLRHDFSVEMTVDQVIRVVNHKKKMVALVSGQGTDCYVFHPAAKITQDLEVVEVEVFLQRKVKMTTEHIIFANNFKCYKFDHEDIEEEEPVFSDLRNDLSVDFLFSSQRGNDTQRAARLAEEAQIEHSENGWSVVKINGVKIIQNERGEVTINAGPKFIRMYPNNMSLQLKSNFLEVRIGINWSVKVSRGSHVLNASHCGFIVTNGRIEAGFDDANKPFACLLPRRVPLLSDHRKLRRRYGSGTHIRHRKQEGGS
ncbi:uncharacterized protein LOC117343387 [Pecten maximus]|uniref:uncharacterized protein LOC117343387 n=1 Tax=Pecten maximus TaxID=6579 RepID=UPI0014582946|nr:uncharacterized protein LOC117343387 [Pecten maximus]